MKRYIERDYSEIYLIISSDKVKDLDINMFWFGEEMFDGDFFVEILWDLEDDVIYESYGKSIHDAQESSPASSVGTPSKDYDKDLLKYLKKYGEKY